MKTLFVAGIALLAATIVTRGSEKRNHKKLTISMFAMASSIFIKGLS